jgi:hypothetical protein
MDFLELIKTAKDQAWKQGLELNVNLRPIRKQNFDKPVSTSTNYKGDIAVDAQPFINDIFKNFIPDEKHTSEDIVFIFFEKIRNEPVLFEKYQELKEKYGTKILNPGLARSVAEFLGLKNRGQKVLIEDKQCLIKSYTKIY